METNVKCVAHDDPASRKEADAVNATEIVLRLTG
jgi:hypothetical protein